MHELPVDGACALTASCKRTLENFGMGSAGLWMRQAVGAVRTSILPGAAVGLVYLLMAALYLLMITLATSEPGYLG